MTRRFRRHPPLWTLMAAVLLGLIAWRLATTRALPANTIAPGEATVVEVRDWRTLLVQQGDSDIAPIRLLGLIGPAASAAESDAAQAWLREHLVGQSVLIELDHRRLDRDGVPLVYLLLGGELINAELIGHGWARPENYPGDSASRGKQLREAVSER